MILKRLKLENFRNYALAELYWDEQVNLICGRNAQGKSNLLEAVCYLGVASSFRGAGEADLIRYGQPHFYLEADILSAQAGRLRLAAAADRRRQRRWTINREPRTRLADIVGVFHTVIFAPEDIYLVKAGPDARRRYLNRQMSQLDREYCRLLIDYNRVLRQRNACLKQWETAPDQAQLEIWTDQLARLGGAVVVARRDVTARLGPLAAALHAALSGGESLDLRYQSAILGRDNAQAATAAEAETIFRAELARCQRAELLRGVTLAGPHRDELAIRLDGRPAREFASQGQQRTVALALKLAELELGREVRGEYPVLLLDDVLSELDSQRRAAILRYTEGRAQTFITAVDDALPLAVGKRFQINAGAVHGSPPRTPA